MLPKTSEMDISGVIISKSGICTENFNAIQYLKGAKCIVAHDKKRDLSVFCLKSQSLRKLAVKVERSVSPSFLFFPCSLFNCTVHSIVIRKQRVRQTDLPG